ncbi:hypothetical protein BU17DRAFT_84389 [Hysterangium stoloniferum]|nr:hypothetical protein BU17DRAFT_84389 [Hysterangium stoloniferum]
MSASDTSTRTLEAIVQELVLALPPVNATRYLSVAGFVVLLYDHILLFPNECSNIWAARWTWLKFFFLLNRYGVPVLFVFDMYMLSGISTAGLNAYVSSACYAGLMKSNVSLAGSSERVAFKREVVKGITSVAILNVFIARRVCALWAHNSTVRKLLIASFIATYASVAVASIQLYRDVTYSPLFRTCIVTEKPYIFIATYAIPILLDALIFLLTCYNACDRPRHMEAMLVKQLITDGIIYFVSLSCLRILNIIIIAAAGIPYTQLAIHFIWSMIVTLVNRMLLTSGVVVVHPGDPSAKETPFKLPSAEPPSDHDDSPWPANFIEFDSKFFRMQRGESGDRQYV